MWIAIAIIFMTLTSVMSNETGNTTNFVDVTNNENKKIDILKCCELNSYLYYRENMCINKTKKLDPPIYKEDNNNEIINGSNIYEVFNVKFQDFYCGDQELLKLLYNIKLFKNGNILKEDLENEYYSPGQYCIDNIEDMNEPQLGALVCIPYVPRNENLKLNSYFMLISCFFIVITIVVYACLPINLHSMVLMAYLSSFLVGFIFLATMNIVTPFTRECVVFTFIIYFSLLSAFFWLNVMCFDIWYTFSGKRSLSGPSSARSQFLSYSMYAFGVPTILTAVLSILEFTIDQDRSLYLPRLFKQKCFISGSSKIVYFYGPIVILCAANLTFFVLTALELAHTNRTIERGLHKTDKKRFTLYIKLFIVMGVNWIFEVISYFFDEHVLIWRFTDAYNLLVGLIIFIIFVCKRKIFYTLVNRIRIKRNHLRSGTDTGERNVNRNRKFYRCQNIEGKQSSIDTIRTTLRHDSKSGRSDKLTTP